MSIHDGHRQRLMERFRQEGLDHFDSVQVLELLLFFCIPRRDTNELAHALLNRFGSVSRVMDASVEELMQVRESKREKRGGFKDKIYWVGNEE